MPEGGGYGVGLFDSTGPTNFAGAVKGIGTELGTVASKFSDLATSATASLGKISASISDVLKQLQGLGVGVTAAGGGGGGGGGMGAGPRPASSGKTGDKSDATNWGKPPKAKDSGNFSGEPSMPLGSADQGPSWFDPMGTAGIWDAIKSLRASQTGPGGGGGTGMPQGSASAGGSMGSRAVQSMIPAAAGAADKFFTSGTGASLVATAVQGQSFGQMFGPAFGVSPQSLYSQMPAGQLVANPADYVAGNIYGAQQGMMSTPYNWSTIQQGAKAGMALAPGMNYQSAVASQNFSAQQLNAGIAVGLNLRPGGQMLGTQQSMSAIWQRATMGSMPSMQTLQEGLQPGGSLSSNLASIGITPGSDQYTQFVDYATAAVRLQQQGKNINNYDLSTTSGLKAAGLDTTAYKQLQATSAKSRLQMGAEPDLATAAGDLSTAASTLLDAANTLTGGIPGGGALLAAGSMAPGALIAGGLGLKVARKVAPNMLKKIPGIGGALATKGGISKGIWGKISGLFGKGGTTAAGEEAAGSVATDAGVVATGETAGLALDATGIGAPLGLALGAGTLAYGFRHQIGNVIGGLFGGGKKKGGSSATSTGDPATDDLMTLLQAKPPTGSLIDLLTQPPAATTVAGKPGTPTAAKGPMTAPAPKQHKKGGGLFGSIGSALGDVGDIASGVIKGLPGIGSAFASTEALLSGGGIGGAFSAGLNTLLNPFAGFGNIATGASGLANLLLGGTAASAQTLSSTTTASPTDLSGQFTQYGKGQGQSQTTSTTSTSGGSGGTGGGSPLIGSSNAQQVFNFLTGKGLKDYQAAGIIGNMAQESRLNPESIGSGGGGLVGWTPLPKGLVTGNAKADMVTQLNYLWNEINTTESGALSALEATTNVTDAATVWMNKFERPRVSTENAPFRVSSAQNALSSKGASYARGTQLIARTQLALLHRGESVVTAADNYSSGGGTYNQGGAMGGGGVYLNFKQGAITLQVSGSPTQQEMDNIAKQFVAAISKPQVLASTRST